MQRRLVCGEVNVVRREARQRGDEAHDGAGLTAVDRGAAAELRGGDDEVGPELVPGVDLFDADAEGAQRIDHACGVVGVQGAINRPGPSAIAAIISSRLVSDLEPGIVSSACTGTSVVGAG